MRIFHASFSWFGSYGAYRSIDCVVVANTQSEALGLALQEYADTDAAHWHLFEIDVSALGVTNISSSES